MRPIWSGWATHNEESDPLKSLRRASIYGMPSHRRTIMVKPDDRPTERFFVALPTLYFTILKTPRHKHLFVFAGEPGWKPSNPVPLYLFPWPDRVGRGAICLGCNIDTMTDSDIINHFFISSFTESFLLNIVQFRVEKEVIQTVRTFQEWQTLSRKYPDLGSHIVLENWALGTFWGRHLLNLRRTPKFTYGQTVRSKKSRYPGQIQMITMEGEEDYRYEIKRAKTIVSLLESEIVEVPK